MDTSRDDPCPLGADVVVCNLDDDSDCYRFHKVGEDPEKNGWWCTNNKLQKL